MTGAHTLERMADRARTIQGVWSSDVKAGDWIIIQTKNSVYSLAAIGDGRFQVAGGWFASHGVDAAHVRILGCTWGGRAILTEMVAAPGMFIEFDNGVQTTRVRDVRVMRGAGTPH
jgi:hypothetical protein